MGRSSDARERLLDSARGLFHEQGYEAVGVSQLCHKAGVKKGSFYHFFPSKQQLAMDLVDELWKESRGYLEEHCLGSGSPLERLRRYCQNVAKLQEDHFCSVGHVPGCPLGGLANEMSTRDAHLRQRLLQVFEAQLGYLERLIREAQDLGEAPAGLDVRQAAEGVLALVQGQVLLAKARNDTRALRYLPELATRLIRSDS